MVCKSSLERDLLQEAKVPWSFWVQVGHDSFSSDAYFADYTSATIFGAKILQEPTPTVEQPASPFLELCETQLRI